MVEGGGLENRCTLTGTVGSNPTSSANLQGDNCFIPILSLSGLHVCRCEI